MVKDGNSDVLADSPNILNRWKNYFYQLLNVHVIHNVRLKYMELSHQYMSQVILRFKSVVRNFKRYKSTGIDQVRTK
jgi:hypothetical protein